VEISLGDRLGLAGLIVGLIGVAVVYLLPDKKWVGWLFLATAFVLSLAWLRLDLRNRPVVSTVVVSILGAILAGSAWWFLVVSRTQLNKTTEPIRQPDSPATIIPANPPNPHPAAPAVRPARPLEHPVINAIFNSVSFNSERQEVYVIVRLANSTQFETVAHCAIRFLVDGTPPADDPNAGPAERTFAFAPPPTFTELSYTAHLRDNYPRFINRELKLTVRVTADYPDRGGRTLYTLEGTIIPGLEHVDVIRSDWNSRR